MVCESGCRSCFSRVTCSHGVFVEPRCFQGTWWRCADASEYKRTAVPPGGVCSLAGLHTPLGAACSGRVAPGPDDVTSVKLEKEAKH